MIDVLNGNASRQPNNVLAECRAALRLSHEKLAYLVREKARDRGIQIGTLDSVTRHIKRIEAGHVRDPSATYKALLCAVLQKTEVFLFGVVSLEGVNLYDSMSARTFHLRNHKLIPAFVGASSAQRIIENLAMLTASTSPTRCYYCTLSHPRDEVSVELCDWIRSQVEINNDFNVEPQHGRRLLRALRSIIINPRPEESAQVYPLRIAVLESSRITEHLDQAAGAITELRG